MSILRIIDFETCGMEPPAEICEFGWRDFQRDNLTCMDGGSYLCGVKTMPPEVRAVHHISLSDCDGLDPFDPEKVLADALQCGVVAMVAHNAEFEAKWIGRTLEGVMPLICTYKAALRVWPDAPSHSCFALLYWLEDQGKVKISYDMLGNSHRAGPDAYATALILGALFESGVIGTELVRWTKEPRLLPKCPIGKFRGKPWADVEHGFLGWMLKQPDMEPDYVWNVQQELNRRNSK